MTERKQSIQDYSRRELIGSGVATGVALSIADRALAQSSPSTAEKASSMALQDPTMKYPRPPFKPQEQPWPGLARRMEPRPDHGETSHRGSGRLSGRRALITGGDSGMGRAAAIAYAREGADVAINYLPAEEEDAQEVIELIKAEGRQGVPIPGDIRSESFCRQLVDTALQSWLQSTSSSLRLMPASPMARFMKPLRV